MGDGSRTTRRRVLGGTAAMMLTGGKTAAMPAPARASEAGGERGMVIEETLNQLSLEEKVAHLFMFPAEGTTMTPAYAERLAAERPGGVILVAPNVGTPEEVKAFVGDIQATNPELPPLVALDQEGGLVARLPGDPAPAAPELGLLPPEEVAVWARQRAAFVAGYGFDVNFAPVADVAYTAASFMAGRAFGDDPAVVAAAVAAYIAGASGTGVVHCAKHFPGHGRASVDSHLALPVVDLSFAEWRESDALPFQAAVEAEVPMVMLGHLLYPQWDDIPTSLSPVAVGVLRDELGFDGVIVTDDLGMAALAAYDPFAVVERAITAGVDLLLYVTPAVPPRELIDSLVARVEAGAVAEERIDASIRRLLRLRQAP